MALADDFANAARLLEQLRSAALHMSACIAALDAASGVGSAVGHPSIAWDMGAKVGQEVQQYADGIRARLESIHSEIEYLVDRSEDLVRTLGS